MPRLPEIDLAEIERFRSMVDLSSDLLLVLAADTSEIIDANATACRRLGLAREQLLGRLFADFLEKPARQELLELLSDCRRTLCEETTVVSSLPGVGGQPFPAEIALGCACGIAGETRITVAAARDISHRLADENALRQSEERYRLLVEQTEDGIFVADTRGRYVDVNLAGCRMLGYSRQELLCLSMKDVLAAEEAQRIGPELASLAGGGLIRSEWRFRRKDGSCFIGEVVGRKCPDGRLQGIVRDISERRAVEERLRQAEEQHRIALDAAELGIWRHDIRADAIWADERAQRYCGAAKDWLPAAELFARVHPDDASRFAETMATALDPVRSKGHVVNEFRIVDSDGNTRWLRVHAHIQFEGEGALRLPVQALGTMEDITARKRVEEQLARLSRAYESLSEINKYVARAGSERYLLAMACRVAVERVGFRLVRVVALASGLALHGGSTCYGPASGILDRPDAENWLSALDETQPLRAMLRDQGHYCSGALENDPILAPWASACAEYGVRAMGVFPLRVAERIAFLMVFSAAEADCFDPAMIRSLEEMAADISFGLDRLAEHRRVRDTEHRFSAVFRDSPSCILITRMADDRVVDANDAFLETFDYSLREVVGRRTLGTSLWTNLDDRTAMLRIIEERGRIKDFETIWRRRSGETRECLVSGEIVLLGGERHLVGMVTDVTARRLADRQLHAREQEFRALAENSPDYIARYDRACRRLYANPAMCRLIGSALPDLLGKSPVESMPDSPVAESVQDAITRVFATAQETELEVAAVETPGGPRIHRHIRLVPEFGADGRVASVLAIGRDVSRLKQTEQRLREIHGQLRDLGARREAAREDERKRMAREIHDVLGQLLTALRLDVDMLGMEFGAEQPLLMERTAKTTELVDSTIAIVRNLASSLRPSALDMGIVSALEWQAREFSSRTGVICEIALRDGDVELDEPQSIAVLRLVQESLTNVARHARARRVELVLARVDDGYRLFVTDDGIGFDPAVEGNGSLGLVGMRERALGLGGELMIHSEPGGGTTIEVRFPAPPTEAPS